MLSAVLEFRAVRFRIGLGLFLAVRRQNSQDVGLKEPAEPMQSPKGACTYTLTH